MILNDNSTQQINTLAIQLQNRITNLNNELKSLNKETSDLNSKISDLERRISSNVNDADDMNTEINNLNSKISDLERRISSLANDAAAMNTEILANTEAISGKADKSHTHTKSQITDFPTSLKNPNALTINGKTYDGSTAVDAGVQTVANGGTGVSTQAEINKAFIANLDVGTSDVTDGTEFVSSYASDSGFNETNEGAVNKPYKRQFVKVWNYIKNKISSVLGLTKDNYGGKASTAGTADTVDNYHASDLWRSDGATWNPSANVTMTPSGNGSEWSFDFRDKNGATGSYWQVWDENKSTLLQVNADDGKVSAPYGFVGNLSGKASTAGTADKTVNDITIDIPYVAESGRYVIPFGNILEPTSTEINSPYNWDITGFFSIIRPIGHNGSQIQFEAGHGYSHDWTTYAYLDKLDFRSVTTSIKAFQYNGKWWLGLCIVTSNQGYGSKMTITYSRGLPATPTCILYNSRSDGVANEEIYNSIQDIPSSWWRQRTICNPTTFTQDIISPRIKANNILRIPIGAPSSLEDGCIWIER